MRIALLLLGLAGLPLLVTCGYGKSSDSSDGANSTASGQSASMQACASAQTVNGVKRRLFDNARAMPGASAGPIGGLERGTVARMLEPVVDQDDAQIRRTICSGRLVLDLPPGTEGRFGGERQLSVRIRYSSQLAADGSGNVYEIFGAESLALRISQRMGGRPTAAALRPTAYPRAVATLEDPAATGHSGSVWDHHGSRVRLQASGRRRIFIYSVPRAGVPAAPGDIVFSGDRDGSTYRGTAYLFSSQCGRVGYAVQGSVSSDDRQVILRGTAPVRDRRSCLVIDYKPDQLVFRYLRGG